jgi:hypothetical protein
MINNSHKQSGDDDDIIINKSLESIEEYNNKKITKEEPSIN